MPERSCAASRMPRASSPVSTPLTSPYGLSLTSRTASSSESTAITGAIGAKISSVQSGMSVVTPVTTVGR
jgi:hypothetical protein